MNEESVTWTRRVVAYTRWWSIPSKCVVYVMYVRMTDMNTVEIELNSRPTVC